MSIRVTQNMLYSSFLLHMRDGNAQLLRAQEAVATQKRITKMSDDPADAARVLRLAEQQSAWQTQKKNIEQANEFLSTADTSLQSVSSILTEVRTLAVQGASGSLSDKDREALADQVESLLQELVSSANTSVGGRFVFGGSRTGSPPFTGDGGDVAYAGNQDELKIEIGPGILVSANVPGGQIFMGGKRGETRFGGSTGVQPGAGPDTGIGVWDLELLHDETVFLGGSGVAAGDSSATGDTVLGVHTLKFTAAGTSPATVSLDGGPAVTFTGTETDLKVASKVGDVVYLDMRGVSSSYAGEDSIEGHGSFALGPNGEHVAIDLAAANQEIESQDGRVLHVDARGVRRTGAEQVTFTGTQSVFAVVQQLADDLRAGQVGSSDAFARTIGNRVDDIDTAKERALSALSAIGGRTQRAQFTSDRLTDLDLVVSDTRANLEEVDLTEAVATLSKTETALQAALTVGQRIGQLSLLNFLA